MLDPRLVWPQDLPVCFPDRQCVDEPPIAAPRASPATSAMDGKRMGTLQTGDGAARGGPPAIASAADRLDMRGARSAQVVWSGDEVTGRGEAMGGDGR